MRFSQEMCFHNLLQFYCFVFVVRDELFIDLLTIILYMALRNNLVNASSIARRLQSYTVFSNIS